MNEIFVLILHRNEINSTKYEKATFRINDEL